MYKCPSCSANLKFNIRKQLLCCEHCDTSIDPYDVMDGNIAEESAYFETTVFTCSECGGRIINEDTTVATFCSYCGSSMVLEGSISKEKSPEYIIPFSKNMSDCKRAYEKMMKKAIFAPSELKDKEYIEKFRGIYMPYWVYSFKKNGPITVRGERSRRSGDYIITKNYDLNCEVDSEYNGVTFDGSASFADSLSSAIAPFSIKKAKPFTPAFLSGFYADTSDVDKYVYREDASEMVIEDSCNRLRKNKYFRSYNVGKTGGGYSLKNAVRPTYSETDLALFPVWFLSYRKNDRIVYAVVNGQNGKVAADLPVDIKKYLFGSLILALPLFILFNLLFTIKPTALLGISIVLAIICIIITNMQLSKIIVKERGEDDKGLMAKRSTIDYKRESSFGEMERVPQRRAKKSSSLSSILIIFVSIFAFQIIIPIFAVLGTLLGMDTGLMSIFIMLGISGFFIWFVVSRVRSTSARKNKISYMGNWKQKLPVLVKPLGAIIISLIVLLFNPVSDLYYYGGAILCMIMIGVSFIDIIKSHNMLTTRKLPHLGKRGGDERA